MGIYINIGNAGFRSARNSEYVDKSGLIEVVNDTLNTEFRCTCVSRCRRFGKSMAAKMLCAYYDRSCDSRELFADLAIAGKPSFEKHLNRYPVIYVDMTNFTTTYRNDKEIISHVQRLVGSDVAKLYPDIPYTEEDDLMDLLSKISDSTGEQFIMIIDEWDAICREFAQGTEAMDSYIAFLRKMFKTANTSRVFAAAYLTGILPIKKYKTESALNNFMEYSMVDPHKMAPFFGFTRNETRSLCAKYGMDFEEMQKWYDGYSIGDEPSMFNPNSVIMSLRNGHCRSYWAKTGAYDSVSHYIQLNYDGVKDDIIYMLSGGRCYVNTTKFQNDMSVVASRDDIFTVLIHLGYLSYDWETSECWIPNKEVAGEMANAVESTNWKNVVDALQRSEKLLKATLRHDEEAVAAAIDAVHDDSTSILSYNDENSLSCVISLAYFSARNNYFMLREFAGGKGFADIAFLPRKNVPGPALVVELKWNQDADTAINQIKRRQYPNGIADYCGEILLVGINYDKAAKVHTCRIENWSKAQ